MADQIELVVPDIGDVADVDVIEIPISVGDSIAKDDAIVILEGEKATMEVPATNAGVVAEILVQVGDKVSQGDRLLRLQATATEAQSQALVATSTTTSVQPVHVPDIGDSSEVDVIEVTVKVGDTLNKDDTLIVLEGEKATMEVPSPLAGTVQVVHVAVGHKVKQGSLILDLVVADAAPATPSALKPPPSASPQQPIRASKTPPSMPTTSAVPAINTGIYASPSVRRIAREFGVDLTQVTGTGRAQRILKEDVQAYVKQQLVGVNASPGMGLTIAKLPEVDFAEYGEIEQQPLTKINKISGANLHRNWVHVPHVTQFDEADITDMEAFRKAHKVAAEVQGFKLTPLAFLMKAATHVLREFPSFNASLSASGAELILKKYFNIGVAVDTPNGLVVPVVRDVDKKGIYALAKELGEISVKARDGKLLPADMQGGCFTISSLGGIGGTAFTPIVNLPEVAILGVSKSAMKPVYLGGEFVARLMLPLSLSYDHRVIDGAQAARFTVYLSQVLSDIRRILL